MVVGKVVNNMIQILYEDNHLLVVVKPIGVLSQSDGSQTPDMLTLLKQDLKVRYHKPGNVYLGLVHRLDKDVGGVMVFAKTSKAAARLSEQIRQHQFSKTYWAIVEGTLVNKEGILEDYIEKKEYYSVISDATHGKFARLSYQVKQQNQSNSLLEISLETGRHHQIRLQFSSRNHPLLGDKRYGNTKKYPIALYAIKLSFYHPITKEKLEFCQLPLKEGYWKQFTMIQ